MKESANHLIQKVFLEINTRTSQQAYLLKDTIDDFLKEHLFPFIETYFDELELSPSQNYQLEDLELSLLMKENLKIDDVIPHIKKQLDNVFNTEKNNITNLKEKPSLKHLTQEENNKNTLLYILEHGNFPWWIEDATNKENTIEALLYHNIEDELFIKKLKEKMKDSIVRKRTISQVSNSFLTILVPKLSTEINKKSSTLLKEVSFQNEIIKLPKSIQTLIWNQIIEDVLKLNTSIQTFEKFCLNIIKHESLKNAPLVYSVAKVVNLLLKFKLISIPSKELKKQLHTYKSVEITNHSNKKKSKQTSTEIKDEKPLNLNAKTDDDSTISKKDLIVSEGVSFIEEEKTLQEKPELELIKEGSIQDNEDVSETKSNTIDEIIIQLNSEEILSPNKDGVYYVQNAGLILLHPFLKSFYKNCDLLNPDLTIKDKTLAVHLLHFLATGNKNQYEHLQLMEKFLCNIPLQHPIIREVELSDKLIENSKELLEAVLKNLPALGSTSIELFQNEFLQRPGKLIFEKNKTKLIIERKTFDLLLNNLPWNISVIKLPWHKEVFFVDW